AGPTAVVTADFNKDGKLDLAVAAGSGVSILLGNGDGTFQPHVDYATGLNPRSVVAADFNGDGNPDLVVANSGDSSDPFAMVSVLLGNGDGTFQAASNYGAGPAPVAVTAGDFNGDGWQDLAVANFGTSSLTGETVTILLGSANGNFQTYTDYAAVLNPSYLVSADFNKDGKLDLAEVNSVPTGENTVTVLLGNGDGTFGTRNNFPAGLAAGNVVVGDFNGDGVLDLAVVNNLVGQPPTVSILPGNGDGTFQAPITVPLEPGQAYIAAGDFNGDGKLDLAVTHARSDTVSILLGNGNGTFQAPVDYATGNAPYAVTVADFNGDGKLDLAVSNRLGSSVSILMGNGDGTFVPHVDYTVGSGSPGALAVGDLNGDGRPDVVVAISTGFVVLLNNGDGTFMPPTAYTGLAGTYNIALGDVNGDGRLDLVTATSPYGTLSVYLGNGDGTFQQSTRVDYAAGSIPGPVAIADFDGDGGSDLAIGNSDGTGAIAIYLNTPAIALFPSPVAFPNQEVGSTSPAQNITVSNPSSVPLNISGATPSNSDFTATNECPSTLAIGAGCAISVSFAPSFIGPVVGTLTIADNSDGPAGNPQLVTLTGTGVLPSVGLAPGGLGFSAQPLNTTSTAQTITLTNGGTAPLIISSITINGNFAIAAGTTCSASTPVNPGANCLITVTFTPKTTGNLTGTLTITDNAPGSPQTATLNGVGIAPTASLSATSLSFAGQLVSTQSGPQTVKLTNTGSQALTIKSISITGDYKQSNSCGQGVNVKANCTFTVIFAPTAGGTRSGAITITDNSGAGVQTVTLTGQGEDFTLSSGTSPTSASIAPGGTATYTLIFAPLGGLNQTVQLACAGAPMASICTVSPNSFIPSGTNPKTVTVRVETSVSASAAPITRLDLPPPIGKILLALLGILALASSCVRLARHPTGHAVRRLAPGLVMLALLALIALGMAACGGSSGGGPVTPAGTYALTVTGAVNPGTANLNHSVTLTLTVQ
ncbi:MAG: FG-GAP-like repeat-containing protein, partial [Terriglobia bacterium]